MLRLARLVLVTFTALATFVAASLQGRVLCYSHCGGHLAVEAPHPETACPSHHGPLHDSHDAGDAGHSDPSHGDQPAPAGCTDVSADFVVSRDTAATPSDGAHVALAAAPAPLPSAMGVLPELSRFARHDEANPPPDSGPLACLRTIVLLA
jgi:hypothetical protein